MTYKLTTTFGPAEIPWEIRTTTHLELGASIRDANGIHHAYTVHAQLSKDQKHRCHRRLEAQAHDAARQLLDTLLSEVSPPEAR